jgi:hypothetical protein
MCLKIIEEGIMKRILGCALLLATSLMFGCADSDSTSSGLSVTNFKSASTVIGQKTFTSYSSSSDGRAVAAYTNDGSYGSPMVYNGKLYVSDYGSNRILVYNSVPTTNGASADFVLGQTDLTSSSTGVSATTLDGPESIRYANGKMFVLDYSNNRVLIWNTPPTTTGVPADVVVGQPDFTTNNCNTSQTELCEPDDMFVVGTKLIVGDSGNNRVMIWNTIPTTDGAPADIVLGQNDFTMSTNNDDNQDTTADTTPSNRTMNYPAGVWSDGTKLVLCDASNNRVLIWNTFPTTNFAPADVVLGQGDFAHYTANDDNQDGTKDTTSSARTLNYPYYVISNGTQLFIADSNNNRVLMWNSIPTTNFAAANKVLGQATFTANTANDDNQDGTQDPNPTARTLSSPYGVYLYGNKLFVADNDNNRFLIFNF